MKSLLEITLHIQDRIGELSEEADKLEEEGLDDSALAAECTKQELEEILEWIIGMER